MSTQWSVPKVCFWVIERCHECIADSSHCFHLGTIFTFIRHLSRVCWRDWRVRLGEAELRTMAPLALSSGSRFLFAPKFFTTLCLNFLLCQMEIVIFPSLGVCLHHLFITQQKGSYDYLSAVRMRLWLWRALLTNLCHSGNPSLGQQWTVCFIFCASVSSSIKWG